MIPQPLVGTYNVQLERNRTIDYIQSGEGCKLPEKLRLIFTNSIEFDLEVFYKGGFVKLSILHQTNKENLYYGEVGANGTILVKLGGRLTLYHWPEFRTKEAWKLFKAICQQKSNGKTNSCKMIYQKRTNENT